MYQSFGKTMAVTLTASVGPQVGQSVYMADGYSFDPNDGHLRLNLNGHPVTVLSKSHFVSLDPKPLQDLTPSAVVTGEKSYEAPVAIPNGTKLYPWPDPKVAELEDYVKRLEAGLEERAKLDADRARARLEQVGKTDRIVVRQGEMAQAIDLGFLDRNLENVKPGDARLLATYLRRMADEVEKRDNCGFDGPTGAE